MRDIKFRAWDNNHKMWFYWNIDEPFSPVWDMSVPSSLDRKSLGQFTGLKDKNGKEIYEGDVIQNGYEGGEVYFNDRFSGFDVKLFPQLIHESKRDNLEYWQNILSSLWTNGKFEIIGNIYENPELLEK